MGAEDERSTSSSIVGLSYYSVIRPSLELMRIE